MIFGIIASLNLPYFHNHSPNATLCILVQIHKVCDRGSGSSSSGPVLPMTLWSRYLCEYTLISHLPTVIRRQVRKLLLALTGNKDKYRAVRDLHALEYHVKEVKQLCASGGLAFGSGGSSPPISLPYDSLIQLIEHLKACVDIAQARVHNWQKFCLKEESVLSFLVEAACLLDEGVAPTILQLLQAALCPKTDGHNLPLPPVAPVSSTSLSRASSSSKRASSEDSEAGLLPDVKDPQNVWPQLVSQLHLYLDRMRLSHFIHSFLLVSNSTAVRWQAHALVLAVYSHSTARDQDQLLSLMWALWPRLAMYGRRAAQFVDLLGYFSLNSAQQSKVIEYATLAVGVLNTQSRFLANHPNASLYNTLASLVHFDGYYLESEPCLVCNNPEVPFSSVKLSSIRSEAKYTTTAHLIKLSSNQLINRISVRITETKKTRMVRTSTFSTITEMYLQLSN